ncbi:MAG: electron transport complex subunit RsxC [Candidatus Omnitrophota bacterium]
MNGKDTIVPGRARTFHGGTHLPEYKEFTVDKRIRLVPASSVVSLPLSQHIGAPNVSLVKVNDHVKMGQRIGEAKAFISAPVHATVSGKVKVIKDIFNPVYGKRPAIVIENDREDTMDPLIVDKDPESLSKEDIINIVKDAGIVGMGGAAFPTHVKLNVPKEKTIDTLIINGAECEPYLTCDHRLMIEKTDEILKGAELVAKALGVKSIFIAIEKNKLGAIFIIQKALRELCKRSRHSGTEVIMLKTKYPQGGEKQLIKAVLKREVPPGKLPLDVGVVVQNVGTCFAIYQAAYHKKPLIERCMTLTGSCLKEPGNFIVRIGTSLKDVIEFSGGFKEAPEKVIIGGPMMGFTQHTLDLPIIKGVTGAIFLSKKEMKLYEETACVRCAKCVDICPVNLMPTEIMRMVKHSRWHYINELYAKDCMECGVCAYICPSRIPLVQYIKLAKAEELKRI